jgi:hypothetical protein
VANSATRSAIGGASCSRKRLPDKRSAIPESDLARRPAAWRSVLASVAVAANHEAADAIAARSLKQGSSRSEVRANRSLRASISRADGRCPSGTDAGQSVKKMQSLAGSGPTAYAEPAPLVRALHPAARVCCGRLGLLAGALSGVGFLGCGARPVARLLGLALAVLGREL